MSELIKHECGIALIRLLKPLEYYLSRYGTTLYGLNKLHLLMQKQHNRGQDGAGIANIKFDLHPGTKYISRLRSNAASPIADIFNKIYKRIEKEVRTAPNRLNDPVWLKQNLDFTGELFMGHLRYGTYGSNKTSNLHPVVRKNNWMTRNLVLAGNFNMTNVEELFDKLIELGQYPVETSDTITILEKIGHFIDEENEKLYQQYRKKGYSKRDISLKIAESMDIQRVLRNSCEDWDGGYVITGMVGHGDAFVLRDPSGIRPAFYYQDEEIVVATSERPAIQTAFNVALEAIKEVKPGHALVIKRNGKVGEYKTREPLEKKSCSFERIYFSRGTDADIYKERKKLGALLTPVILKSINYDLENTVFSFIPNTASVAYRGMLQELSKFCDAIKRDRILDLGPDANKTSIGKILAIRPRAEDVAVKDVKLRTFITQDAQREDLVTHVYDVTYGSVRPGKDKLVVIDDSIVRGTTLKRSIIRILDRLKPKKIIVASSAPQIRYPDCYGIDMAKLNDFIAFRAAIELLKESKQESILNEVYREAKTQEKLPMDKMTNVVKKIYKPFSAQQISDKISEMLHPEEIQAGIQIIYQSIEDLHAAIPNHRGDWYFTGEYPTPGGNRVANRSFINYIEGKDERAY
ncbi:MAG: amidophosphoribosyltransferase [Bacteroidales bacterium]|nr:amidophosphoribosyltransferase [Bacteroidales bacterium]MCF8388338.1 amidophosphoribosyltransferase [Bacteroidales bacterium]MCF8398731.1 amidophosphoribosyltransferase [Bacteroidales bacterium]